MQDHHIYGTHNVCRDFQVAWRGVSPGPTNLWAFCQQIMCVFYPIWERPFTSSDIFCLFTNYRQCVVSRFASVLTDQPSWSQWSDWGPCSVSCGDAGQQQRTRFCLNGQCRIEESDFQERSCVETKPCPGLSLFSD